MDGKSLIGRARHDSHCVEWHFYFPENEGGVLGFSRKNWMNVSGVDLFLLIFGDCF